MTLPPREAKLRDAALSGIGAAAARLERLAFWDALYNRPGAALQAIAGAETKLRLAKAALRKWRRA